MHLKWRVQRNRFLVGIEYFTLECMEQNKNKEMEVNLERGQPYTTEHHTSFFLGGGPSILPFPPLLTLIFLQIIEKVVTIMEHKN